MKALLCYLNRKRKALLFCPAAIYIFPQVAETVDSKTTGVPVETLPGKKKKKSIVGVPKKVRETEGKTRVNFRELKDL